MAGAPLGVERRQYVGSSMDATPAALAGLDFSDKSVRTGLILAVNIACITLNVVFVSARLLVRRLMTRQYFLDDTLVVIAAFFTVFLCGICLVALPHGFGQHVWNLAVGGAPIQVEKTVQLMFIANIFYACAITFTKLSIIVSYLRIFPYNSMRIAMYITGAITVALFVASIPATIFQCNPISAAWDFSISRSAAKCYLFIHFLYATTAVNVTTDLILCTAPLPFFWNLQLPRKQKVIVSMLFFVGGFACVASIIRLTVLGPLDNSIDVTWHLAPSVLWTIAECTIGNCCVSVPALRPLFSRLLPGVFLTRRAGGGGAAGTTVAGYDTAARRRAYAMGGRGGDGGDSSELKTPRTPADEERATSSQTELEFAEEQVPRSWFATLGYAERQPGSKRPAPFTVTTCEGPRGISRPENVLLKKG